MTTRVMCAALWLGAAACSTGSQGGPAAPGVEAPDVDWAVEVAFESGTKLGGCAVGELDPTSPGGEIVSVAGDGQVWVTARIDGAWSTTSIARLPGEAIGCVVADLLPDIPGDEIVTVGVAEGGEEDGGPGVAHLLARTPDGWSTEILFEDDALLHGVDVGDLNGDDRLDVIVAGYSRRVHVLERDAQGDSWRVTSAGVLPDVAKSVVVVGSPDAERPARAVVGCRDGSLIEFRLMVGGALGRFEWASGSSSQARLGALPPGVLVASDGGTLATVLGPARMELYASGDKLRGAVAADVDPHAFGTELCTAGYDGAVVVTHRIQPAGAALVVARDDDRLHHLAAGRLAPGKPPSLVACGYSGRLIVITRR